MNAAEARSVAKHWVEEELRRSPGEVLCAFTGGSINEMADTDPFPASSDLDLMVVVPKLDPARHWPCKRPYRGIPIEAVYLPRDRLLSSEALLGDFALAPQMVKATVLFDPDRILEGLRAEMAAEYARRHWIRVRCRGLRDHALSLITAFESSDSVVHLNGVAFHAVRSMAQMGLVAELRNPTVKKALVKARDVLAAYGLAEEHRGLLRLVGAAELGDQAILATTSDCRHALDQACHWLRTRFMGDNCVTVHARPWLDVDVPAYVAGGTGREVFLWVGSLYVHVMIAIQNDAPAEVAAAAREVYLGDMAHIRAATLAEARAQMLGCRDALERMTEICDDLVARNARAVG